jgi:hypothetical protein
MSHLAAVRRQMPQRILQHRRNVPLVLVIVNHEEIDAVPGGTVDVLLCFLIAALLVKDERILPEVHRLATLAAEQVALPHEAQAVHQVRRQPHVAAGVGLVTDQILVREHHAAGCVSRACRVLSGACPDGLAHARSGLQAGLGCASLFRGRLDPGR